jgi:hypothetical protein
MSAQGLTWANGAEHAKGPAGTGPVAPRHDVDAQHTTRYDRDAERGNALAQRNAGEAALPSLRRRRQASYRLPALPCGHRDPLSCIAHEGPFTVGPCRYGLTEEQARRHGNDLVLRWGFTLDEVADVLGIAPRAA